MAVSRSVTLKFLGQRLANLSRPQRFWSLLCYSLSVTVPLVSQADFESLRKSYLELRNRDTVFAQDLKWVELDQKLAHYVEVTIDHQHKHALVPSEVGDALVYRSIIAEGLFKRKKDPALMQRAHAVLARMVRLFSHHTLRDDALLRRIELYRVFETKPQKARAFTEYVAEAFPTTPAGIAAERYLQQMDEQGGRRSAAIQFRNQSKSWNISTSHKPTVLIDPGHGGDDTGARGARELREKDITLAIARELRGELERRGIRAVLTRDADKFVSLSSRTRQAVASHAHVLLSIHCNASVGHGNRGVEFYVYDRSIDTGVFTMANHGSGEGGMNPSSIVSWLAPLVEDRKRAESDQLAESVRSALKSVMKGELRNTELRQPKQAPFYVLRAVTIPGVLVELLFVDHEQDGELLSKPTIRQGLVDGLADGVVAYFKQQGKER